MFKNKINLLAALLLTSSAAFAGSIVNSPHDLSATNAGDNGEVCVYCHTPHAANVAFDGAPLWNKAAASVDYMMYGATVANTAGATIAGTETDAVPASPSLACLSCHDGVSAIDSIVNAPGSGLNTITGTTDIANLGTTYGGNIGGDINETAPGSATTNTVTTVGAINLANDHPVSIPYTADVAGLRATGTMLNTTGSLDAWLGATDIASLLRNGNVECGSCHDPHNGGNTQGTATEVNFLRHTNDNSDLCVGCHNK